MMRFQNKKGLPLPGSWTETKQSIAFMRKLLRPFHGYILTALLVHIFSLGISYASTIAGKYVVDDSTGGELNVRSVVIMAAAAALAILFGACAKMIGEYLHEKFTFSIRASIFDRTLHASWLEISRFHSGDVVTRLTSDVASLSSGLITMIPNLILVIVQLLLSFGILFYYDRPLAVFALVMGPLGACLSALFRNQYKQYQAQLRKSESEYRSFMQESISGIAVVKAFQQENAANDYIRDIRLKRLRTIQLYSRITSAMNALSKLIYSLGYVAAFCWGTYRISNAEITYGTLTLFITLVSQVQGAVSNAVHMIPQGYSMLICANRIREIADLASEDNSPAPSALGKQIGLTAQNVSFAYDTKPVLQNVNLTIHPGDRVGIIGRSGAGKTTLIRLFLSLVEPTEGVLFYVDAAGNAEKISARSRSLISYVPQSNTIFSGSIESNLRFGNPNATDEALWAALELADAAEFVKNTEHGLQTQLSEHAGGLSEGQAQRIAIARALLRDRPILILDEATSALDEYTESRILKRILENTEKTCLIISHRQSMLKYCNRILELSEHGTVTMQ